jgi:hypothetical protein
LKGDPIEVRTFRLHGLDLRRPERLAEEERRNVSELLREAIGLLFESRHSHRMVTRVLRACDPRRLTG